MLKIQFCFEKGLFSFFLTIPRKELPRSRFSNEISSGNQVDPEAAAGGVTMGNFPNPARAPIPSCDGSRAERHIWPLIISLLIQQFEWRTYKKKNPYSNIKTGGKPDVT